jgi:hypothetical protein
MRAGFVFINMGLKFFAYESEIYSKEIEKSKM